mgnify:CR=1 FL=1
MIEAVCYRFKCGANELSFGNILQHCFVEGEVRHQAIEVLHYKLYLLGVLTLFSYQSIHWRCQRSLDPINVIRFSKLPSPKQNVDANAQWKEVVDRYEKPLLTFFLKRTNCSSDAEDLVQEVFARLWAREKNTPILKLDSYLFQTAANVLNDYFRKRKVRQQDQHFFSEDEQVFGSDFSTERVLLGKDEIKSVLIEIKKLPQKTQDIFVLRAFEGKRSVEVAEMMNVSVRSIEKHMAKALVHLNQTIRKTGD